MLNKKSFAFFSAFAFMGITAWAVFRKSAKSSGANALGDKSLPRGYRNNNPLNIRISNNNWQGKITPNTDGAFEQFKSMAYGFRAGFVLLRNYIAQGDNTIRRIISRWAPASENNTANYINIVVGQSGIGADVVIAQTDKSKLIKIAHAMSAVENGWAWSLDDIERGWILL